MIYRSEADVRRDNDCAEHMFTNDEPIAQDWEGKDLFAGDEVLRFFVGVDELLVINDDREIANFITEYFNPREEIVGDD